ncbi:acetyltransferase [Metabacillus idriensis]|uniref:acetyltransferase n=1 Tax=Metabacillus idriensis TaxID=324768 RepID=UPI00174B3A5A|nr:acetyltransferase [Metabacillus idriensis]
MKIAVIGQGGHSKVVCDMIMEQNSYQITAVLDDKFEATEEFEGVIYGQVKIYHELLSKYPDIKFFVAIGDNNIRMKIVEELNLSPNQFATIIHPAAIVSQSAKIGVGTVLMPGCIVNANTKIGDHSIINTGSIIEHDNCIKDFVHISPNATLTGSVTAGTGSHIGASATIIPNKTIGEWAIVGAGSVVIHNISNRRTAVGIPARYLDKKDRKENLNEQKNLLVSSAHERK